MGDVINKLIIPLREQFTLPRQCEDEARFFATYVNLLKGQPDDALSAAAASIMATRIMRTFPLPAECLAACREASETAVKAAPKPVARQLDEWSAERAALADELICCDMGRTAAREGWIIGMHDFCREAGRAPDIHEAREIRRVCAALNADVAGLGERSFLAPWIAARAKRMEKMTNTAWGVR